MNAVLIITGPSAALQMLRGRLAEVPEVHTVDLVATVGGALERLRHGRYAFVLIDAGLLGTEPPVTVEHLLFADPNACIYVLTLGRHPDSIAEAIAAGAGGYLAWDAAAPEIALALSNSRTLRQSDEQDGGDGAAKLSARELQVLEGMAAGRSNGEIGAELFLSEDTVKTHARRLYRKMEVNDRAHAVAEGLRQHLIH